VNALIVTVRADLARSQAMADTGLVSGGEDVRLGVVLAQWFGVCVSAKKCLDWSCTF